MTMTAATRHISLDAVRGFAVMGILAMNIVAFAMPSFAYIDPTAYGDQGPISMAVWGLNFVFIDSKMRGLFSILFGASTMLVIESAMRGGRSPAVAHYARMVTLLLFGLIHFYLIWFGDILVLYAFCGMILYLFRNADVRRLRNWGIGLIAAQTVLWSAMSGFLFFMQTTVADQTAPPEQVAEFEKELASFKSEISGTTETVAAEIKAYTGNYSDAVAFRVTEMGDTPFTGFFMAGLETVGLMLLGAALYKSGMLTGGWDRERYRRWALMCFAISIPGLSALLWWQISTGYDPIASFTSFIAFSLPFDVMMAVGWASLLMLWVKVAPNSAVIRRVAAAGRAAFSNYLGTSLIMTFLFYGYGLGLFGTVDRAPLYLFVFGAWAIMLAWSLPWLQRYRYGPLEWLWRSLARGQLQPMQLK